MAFVLKVTANRLRRASIVLFTGLAISCLSQGAPPHPTENPKRASGGKIFEIHSYEKDFPWTRLLRDAFRSGLGPGYQFEDHYLEAKVRPLDEKRLMNDRATLLKALQESKPRLVFLTDDLAVKLFAAELCERKTPFVFAGLNGEVPPELAKCDFKAWGGVLERYYVRDSLRLLARVLGKKSLRVLALLEDSETSKSVLRQMRTDAASVPGIHFESRVSSSFNEWKKIIAKKSAWDAFFPVQPYALHDEGGNPVKGSDVVSWIARNSTKATVYTASWHIRCGGLLAITHEPSAQGRFAAHQAKQVLAKRSPHPVTPPSGDIEINTATAKKLNIIVPFDMLSSATLHRSVQSPCSP